MDLNIDVNEVNDEIDRINLSLNKVKKEEEKSEDILQRVKQVKSLREEVAISKLRTKCNYEEAQKIWTSLKKGMQFRNFIILITT